MKKLEKTQNQELNQVTGTANLKTDIFGDYGVYCSNCPFVANQHRTKEICEDTCKRLNEKGPKCPDCGCGVYVVRHMK
ncbi:MAG: hypothetical protein Q4E88_01070 [Coriobacteriia bacterium]|nr:hypothetical protein [Coriobacteriia bacterium]